MPLDTVRDLLTAIDALPAADRHEARARVEAALDRPAPAARAALGMLALDLVGSDGVGRRSVGPADHLIVVPELQPATRSAMRAASTASSRPPAASATAATAATAAATAVSEPPPAAATA